MNSAIKSGLTVLGSILSLFLFLLLLILLYDYLYAIVAITTFVLCVSMLGYYAYKDLLEEITKNKLEEDEIMARFNGDSEKIRFYKGFKKYFDGYLTAEELEKWFINHPIKN